MATVTRTRQTGPTPPVTPEHIAPRGLESVDAERLADLIDTIERLSLAHQTVTVQDIVKHAARRLAHADGATIVLRDGEQCFYVDEDAVSPLWKGRRFPMSACISGWAMQHRQSVAIADIYADARIPHDAYRPTFVRSLLMTPIRSIDPIGAIGVYWADVTEVSGDERALLAALADTTAVALENVRVWEELEGLVRNRTAELVAEVAERRRAEEEVRSLSLMDDLTGLRNRRGFMLLAGQAFAIESRYEPGGMVLFADVDGLKAVNDSAGHEAGDELLRAAATALSRAFRGADVVGRLGGDEFAAYVPHLTDPAPVLARLEAAVAAVNAEQRLPSFLVMSVGVAVSGAERGTLGELLAEADRAMYRQKRTRKAGMLGVIG